MILFYFVLLWVDPLGESKPVCICSLGDRTNLEMSETCRHCHTYKREHRLDQVTQGVRNSRISSNIYIKMTELPPGLEKKNIPNDMDFCCSHTLRLLFL